jgi:hypothetical protein
MLCSRMSSRIPARRKILVAGTPYCEARSRSSSLSHASNTREGIPCCERRRASSKPAGPAPTMIICRLDELTRDQDLKDILTFPNGFFSSVEFILSLCSTIASHKHGK